MLQKISTQVTFMINLLRVNPVNGLSIFNNEIFGIKKTDLVGRIFYL